MTLNDGVPGYYGKVPCLGDFVSRRLPRQFIVPWDSWLQSSLAASQERLGRLWLDTYLFSPVWRFALSPGLCGDRAVAGVVMPSVDRVGRYFPLTLAAHVPPHVCPFLFLYPHLWFDRLESLALTTLEDGFQLESFDRDLAALSLPVELSGGVIAERAPGERAGASRRAFQWALHDEAQLPMVFADLSRVLLNDVVNGFSMWGKKGTVETGPSLLLCEGMPPLDAYASFLDGSWSDCQWNLRRYAMATVNGDDTQPVPVAADKPQTLLWNSFGISVVGQKRKINEDAMLDRPDMGLWVVADGMGGHRAGDVASRAVVTALAKIELAEDLDEFGDRVADELDTVNLELWRMGQGNGVADVIGTTVVAVLARQSRIRLLWAGDSRVYRFRAGTLEQLTRDHSATEAAAHMNGVPEISIPKTNVITRAVGAEPTLDLDGQDFSALSDDVYIVCSDGLDKELDREDIARLCHNTEPRAIAESLIEKAESRGARDNVTVIVILCRENT